MTKILVAIANHGSGNRQYLDKLIQTYQAMPYDIKIVVLSNIEKDLGPDVEVLVGVPTSNPWSLPFAHRSLFRREKDNFDFFIYSEDDTLISQDTVEAFIHSVDVLKSDEIAGFIRTEQDPQGNINYCTVHSHIRWIADTVCERGGKLWAQLSNEHSALFIATRAQLQQAIQSGGFPEEPHERRYDMLCSAATDIYIFCGLKRLVCIDDIEKFTLLHLPNKYLGHLGVSEKSLALQFQSLRKIHAGELSAVELFNVESSLPRFPASKNLFENSDETLRNLIGLDPKKILFWGTGDGALEKSVTPEGISPHAVLFGQVFFDLCQSLGIQVIDDPSEPSLKQYFDTVVSIDTVHLTENPNDLIEKLHTYLLPGGKIILRVPNLHRLRFLKLRIKNPIQYSRWNKTSIGVHAFTAKSLKHLLKNSGFSEVSIRPKIADKWVRANKATFGVFEYWFAANFYAVANK